jgi:galactosamine-6-phosphate isomerase
MHIRYFQDFDAMSQAGFELVKQAVEAKPDLLFCVASGGSPAGLYAKMLSEKAENPAFGSALRVIKLDEWGGLEAGSTFTSEHDVQTKMVQPMGISTNRYWTIDPWTPDPEKACAEMEAIIQQQGPIDICILGIGVNGHIALNEPGEVLRPEFHVCALAESTLNNGMIKSLKQPPTFGMTMGVGNILQSKKILLFIAGSGKKEAFKRLLQPEVSTQFPASLLWLHPDVEVLVDERVIG